MISAERVHEILLDCLYKNEELPEDGSYPLGMIEVQGIMPHLGLHPERVEQHKDEIASILRLLPRAFREHEGGGWSFLNMCMCTGDDGKEHQWGDHPNMDELLMLGLATKLAEYGIEDRVLWQALPGGVPYIVLKVTDEVS